MMPEKVKFIIGAPRSGTTALLRFMTDKDTLPVLEREKSWYCHNDDEIKEYYTRQLRAEDKSVILDKNPRNSFRIFRIQHIYPEVEFTHIIRDGRAQVASWLNHRKGLGKRWWYHEFDTLESAAYLWNVWVGYVLRHKHHLNNYKEVKYEDLCEEKDYFKSRNYKWEKNWTNEQKATVTMIQEPLLRKLGYL